MALTYEQVDFLSTSPAFQGRVRACTTQEAQTFRADERRDIAALALDVLTTGGPTWTFARLIAAFPGLSPEHQPGSPEGPGPPIDQALISDAVILGQVQEHWPTVAALFWDDEGNRREVT